MKKDTNLNSSQLQNNQSIVDTIVDCHLSDVPLNPSENIHNPDSYPPTVPSSLVEDEPEFCPEAVDVCRVMKKDTNMNSLQLQNDQSIVDTIVDCHLSDVPLNPSQNIHNLDSFPPTAPSSLVEDVSLLENNYILGVALSKMAIE